MGIELWAYGDESGIDGPRYCLMMGYVGSQNQWSSFKRSWERVLRVYEVPKFHAIELFHGKKQYRAWPREKRRQFLDELIAIIHWHQIVPVGVAVDTEAFSALSLDERRYQTGAHLEMRFEIARDKLEDEFNTSIHNKFTTSGAQSRPYFVAFNHFLSDVFDVAPPGALLHIVLDAQTVVGPRAEQTFNEIWEGGGYPENKCFVSLDFADSLDSLPLQAADLYTYAWARCLNNRMTVVSEDVRHVLRELVEKGRIPQVVDTEYFQRELAELRADLSFERNIAGIGDDGSLEINYGDKSAQ